VGTFQDPGIQVSVIWVKTTSRRTSSVNRQYKAVIWLWIAYLTEQR